MFIGNLAFPTAAHFANYFLTGGVTKGNYLGNMPVEYDKVSGYLQKYTTHVSGFFFVLPPPFLLNANGCAPFHPGLSLGLRKVRQAGGGRIAESSTPSPRANN